MGCAMEEAPSTRAMEIFSDAATSDAAARETYLDRACAGDTKLREEVESLLAMRDRIGDFLNSPISESEGEVDPRETTRQDADDVEGSGSAWGAM